MSGTTTDGWASRSLSAIGKPGVDLLGLLAGIPGSVREAASRARYRRPGLQLGRHRVSADAALSLAEAFWAMRNGEVPSHVVERIVDGRKIGSYQELAAERQAEQSVASRLDPHQSKVPKYPKVDGRQLHRLGYLSNEVVRGVFDLIIGAATQAIPELRNEDGKAHVGPAAKEFDLLMRCPAGVDSDLTGSDLWVRFWLDVLGTGNGMIEMVPGVGTDFPVRLWRIDPALTYIVPSATERIDKYVYRLGGQLFDIPKERVLHFRLWDPLADFWGVPKLFSALRSLATDRDLIDMFKVTLQNLGVPPVVLEYPMDQILAGVKAGQLSMVPDQDMLTEIRDKWQEKQGGRNRGRTGVAWGYQVKLIGLDFAKLAIGELVATTERRILMAHGVNPLLVGQTGTGQQRGHNFREAREFFYATVVGSLLSQAGGVFDARLARQFGEFLRFGFRTDHIDIIRDARLRRGGEAADVFRSGILRRHACQRLIGEPSDGENIFYPDVYGSSSQSAGTGHLDDE